MQITRSKQYGARTHSKESATSPTAKPLLATKNHSRLAVLPIFGIFTVIIIDYG
jgi:hypothetical protein